MNREILVCMDFSNSAVTALRISVDIANRVDSDVKMVWVETIEKDRDEAEAIMKDFCASFGKALNGKNIGFEIIKGKKVHSALVKFINQEKPYLVVIGANGNSGYDERFAGANTFKTINDSNVPVLSIRENFDFNKPLDNIILPIDSTEETRQKVPWVVDFARMFPQSTIRILGLLSYKNNKPLKDLVYKYVESVEDFLSKRGLRYTADIRESDNVTLTTLEYAKEVNADMVVIMTEQEKTLSNLFFLGPYAQQMINLSSYPVLAISPRQTGAYSI
ncbi:MAG: universal stress protein [Synergistales bacterium]|nr:universal stress protein [Bacteroidales bacterium]MDY6435409.1 universal stress protein [Synergistales bacterium]MDY6393223.1 universal stress protein [Bacteroidales bacterium]MDY6396017.1 universal stress protein [Bacteroidales bacterium]MDY6402950.1 universal stress protein [Bacteroidales bacterium]